MKMENKNDKNRVGIYTQVSAEATAVGEGLAPKGEKSPVATTESNKNLIKESNSRGSDEQNEYDNEYATANTSLAEENKSEGAPGSSIAGDDSQSNNSGGNSQYDSSFRLKPGSRGYERNKMNRATKLREFPRSERYYGKERWNKSLSVLQNIGFVNWEINTMLEALDKLAERRELEDAHSRKRKSVEPTLNQPVKVQRVETVKCKDPDVISGILTPTIINKEIPTPNLDEKEESYMKVDLRVNIGDASQPDFRILPEYRTLLEDEVCFLVREANIRHVAIKHSLYINQTLLVDCSTHTAKEFLRTRLSDLNNLWPGANLVLCKRITAKRRAQIFIPYTGIETQEILQIIKKQNKLTTEAWIVNKREELKDETCLDVVFDEITSLRILEDQDDLYFLLTRATVKVPVEDEV